MRLRSNGFSLCRWLVFLAIRSRLRQLLDRPTLVFVRTLPLAPRKHFNAASRSFRLSPGSIQQTDAQLLVLLLLLLPSSPPPLLLDAGLEMIHADIRVDVTRRQVGVVIRRALSTFTSCSSSSPCCRCVIDVVRSPVHENPSSFAFRSAHKWREIASKITPALRSKAAGGRIPFNFSAY